VENFEYSEIPPARVARNLEPSDSESGESPLIRTEPGVKMVDQGTKMSIAAPSHLILRSSPPSSDRIGRQRKPSCSRPDGADAEEFFDKYCTPINVHREVQASNQKASKSKISVDGKGSKKRELPDFLNPLINMDGKGVNDQISRKSENKALS